MLEGTKLKTNSSICWRRRVEGGGESRQNEAAVLIYTDVWEWSPKYSYCFVLGVVSIGGCGGAFLVAFEVWNHNFKCKMPSSYLTKVQKAILKKNEGLLSFKWSTQQGWTHVGSSICHDGSPTKLWPHTAYSSAHSCLAPGEAEKEWVEMLLKYVSKVLI